MSTRHFMTGISRTKQVFLTNRTIAHILASFAVVIVKQKCINAHAAVVAMLEIFAPTHSTKAAVFTMVGSLAGGHPKVANVAMIFAKLYAAIDALVAVFE
jgi:hypothetical protein